MILGHAMLVLSHHRCKKMHQTPELFTHNFRRSGICLFLLVFKK
jgi:hypothetical protein